MPVRDKDTGKWWYSQEETKDINYLIWATRGLLEDNGFQAFRDHLEKQTHEINSKLTPEGERAAKNILRSLRTVERFIQIIDDWETK